MSVPRIFWVPSPMFNRGHPAPLIALVHHRMVGNLRGTDAVFSDPDGRAASTNFGVGYNCEREGHPQGIDDVHVHQYVRLGDQAWGNGNWDPSGKWDDRYPTTNINSRTISIEHHDNGQRKKGDGKGVVPEQVIRVSIELDRLLLAGDTAAMRDAGIRFRDGTADDIGRELRRMDVDRHHIIDHHYISGNLKPFCWRPWADDPTGFPQDRYLAELSNVVPPPSEEIVKSYPVPTVPSIGTVAKGTWLYATSALEPSPDNVQVDPGRDLPYLGQPTSTYRIVEYVDSAGKHSGRSMFVKAGELTNIQPAPDSTPYSEAQKKAAEAQAADTVRDAAVSAANEAAAAFGA